MARKSGRAKRGLPWKPPALDGLTSRELDRLAYVVVEEKIDDLIGLLISEWPRGGAGGRPVFSEKGYEEEVVVDVKLLQRRLSRRRIPKSAEPSARAQAARQALQRRDVAIGDVFAARLVAGADPQEVVDRIGVAKWIAEIVDITAGAREAAKAATYEALTPPLKPKVAAALRKKRDEAA